MLFHKRPEEVRKHELYIFIENSREKYPIYEMCHVLKVSKSGYYRFRNRLKAPEKEDILLAEIKKVLEEHPDNDNYGRDRMQKALEQKGINRSIRTVYRVMKKYGFTQKTKRHPNGITKADAETQKSENLIKRDFTA